MKAKIIRLIIFFNLIILKIYSQQYFSFIDTNSVWRDYRVECNHGSSYLNQTTWDAEEYLKGDTIIGFTYSKLYLRGNKYHYLYDHGTTTNDSTFYCNLYIGGLREDSLKQVYYINTNGVEKLLFNFNVVVGDSVLMNDIYIPAPGQFYAHVTSIDSVYIYDRFRKRINFNYNGFLVEGIGKSYGLFGINEWNNSLWICGYDHSKTYFYKNSPAYRFPNSEFPMSLYPNDSTSSLINCNELGLNEILNPDMILVYPNPSEGLFIIESPAVRINNIKLYNVFGELVFQSQIDNFKSEINFSEIVHGIYFMAITDEKKNIVNKKILIQ